MELEMKVRKIRYFFALIIILVSIRANAQQEPMFTQYMFNTLSVNPAYAGTRNALNINTLTRLQWVGMDGAPKTFSLGVHTPYDKKKIGVGITLISDEVGPVRNTYFTLNYAYRINLNENVTLSMGIKGGINSYYAGISDLKIRDPEDAEFQKNEKQLNPNLGVGFYLYSDKYYIGVSAPKLIQTKVDKDYASSKNELKRHYYIIGGYIFKINSRWDFKPTVLIKAVSGAPLSNDITMQFLYNNRLWLGAMYRIGDAAGLFLDFKINEQLSAGYGYDFSLNGLSGVNSGSHEIMLSYDFDNLFESKVKSPRYF